jgi:hypothetical protein
MLNAIGCTYKQVMRNYYIKTLSIILGILFLPLCSCSQSDTTRHCIDYASYYRMDIKKFTSIENPSSNLIQIILEDVLPPIQWWRTSISQGQTPNFSITEKKKYLNQKLVRILNTSNTERILINPDHRLSLALQAKNEAGKWVTIEKFDTVEYCALSFKPHFNDTIKPNYECQTFTEFFPGEIKTKYRIFLFFREKNKKSQFYISNEIDGTIERCKLAY